MSLREPSWLAGDDKSRDFLLTLCSLSSLDAIQPKLDGLLADHRVQDRQTPSSGVALLKLNTRPAPAWALFQTLLAELDGVDLLLRPLDTPKPRLLICDMDMTLVDAETLDEVAGLLGIGDRIAPITAAAMRGELEFNESLAQRIALLAGESIDVFHQVARQCRLMPGAQTLLDGARATGMHCILVSGGFAEVAEPVAKQLGFDEVHCNRLELDGDELTGRVSGTVVNADFKRELLVYRSQALGIPLSECCAIGDGANDIPMIQTAGLGIAYHGKPAMRDATPCQINHTDLTTALHFMLAAIP